MKIPRLKIKKPEDRRPEFVAEALAAKGKKYIVMSDTDKVDYATDSVVEAIVAFSAVMSIAVAKYKIDGDDPRIKIMPMTPEVDPESLVTTNGNGMVGLLVDSDGKTFGEQAILAVCFGLTSAEWFRYGLSVLDKKNVDRRVLDGKPADYKYAYAVVPEGDGGMFETDDFDEAMSCFVKACTEATLKYGYGPGNPVAIQFQPVPDHTIDLYPSRHRLKEKTIIVGSISGHAILLGALEGVYYKDFEPVVQKYLSDALNGEVVHKVADDVVAQLRPPQNLKEGEEAVSRLGSRYVVMDEKSTMVVATDDEYEAMMAFYAAQEKYALILQREFGDLEPIDYTIKDGPTWSDTTLPTLVCGMRVKGRTEVIGLIGMSKRTHDLLLEAQQIPQTLSERNSPWKTAPTRTLH